MPQSLSPARIVFALILIVGSAFGVLSGIVPLWFVEVPLRILFGWVRHTVQVIPRASVNWSGVGLFAVLLPLTALLAHSSAGWLWTSVRVNDAPWRWKWTVLGLTSVLLMFAAGIGATGVVHQTGWLITSNEELVTRTGSARLGNVRCQNNLRQISLALQIYARENAGYQPADQADFIRVVFSEDVSPTIFVCPSSNDEPAPVTQPSDWVNLVEGGIERSRKHVSYHYLSRPVQSPGGERMVMVYELNENHEHGINVLYADGEVDSIGAEKALPWLESIGAPLTRNHSVSRGKPAN